MFWEARGIWCQDFGGIAWKSGFRSVLFRAVSKSESEW